MDIVWSRVSSGSGYRDGVFGVCVYEDRVYAAGFDELYGLGRKRFRIEAYSARDGTPLARWADERSHVVASLTSCAVLDGRVYAFGVASGFWSILVFDRDLGLVKRLDVEKPFVVPSAAMVHGGYVYVAGVAPSASGLSSMFVARLAPDDLSIEKSFSVDMRGFGAGAYAIAFSSDAKRIVVGGFDRVEGSTGWLVVFLTEDLELIKVARPGIRGSITGLAVGADGSIYAVNRSRTARLGKDGEMIASTSAIQGVKVYAHPEEHPVLGSNIVVVSDNEAYLLSGDSLSIVDSVRLSRGPQILTAFTGSMAVDSSNVYVAATQVVTKDDWNWVVMALRPRGRGVISRFFRRR
uniref:WD40 repeat domain-containing protein n=1 Tax=Ignisphaera aggregans TaxID=334771 RepID=A0A7C2V9Z3_9CREN